MSRTAFSRLKGIVRQYIGAVLVCGLATAAAAQSVPLQAGPFAPGHVPVYAGAGSVYAGAGSGQPLVQDSGTAAGTGGPGIKELLLTKRGIGSPPYAAGGLGPFGTNLCDTDGPVTGPYHFLCFDANAGGVGMLAYGAANGAAPQQIDMNINGTAYPFPFVLQGIVGPPSSSVGHLALFNNAVGTLLTDVDPAQFLGQVPIAEFGAKCDGATDDTAAVAAAGASGKTVSIPSRAICLAARLTQAQLIGKFVGGQIKTLDGSLRGPVFGMVGAAPAQSGAPTGFGTWANGDMSHPLSAEEYHITGAATAGQPTTGYQYVQGIDPHYAYFDTNAGWNQSTSGNDGRTGQSYEQITMQHNGQGDLTVRTSEIFCNGIPKVGGTNFLANPACAAENGDIIALQDGQFLQKEEFHIVDNGHQVAAVNRVAGFQRNNANESLNETWEDTRADCRPVACDAWASVTGYWGIGLTFLGPASNTPATIVQSSNEYMYLNASNNDNNANPSKTVLGGDRIGTSYNNQSVDIEQNGGPSMRFKNNPNPVDAITASGAPAGSAVSLSATGADASIPFILQDKGGGGVVIQSNGAFAAKFSGPSATANYLNVTGAAAGGAPIVSSAGTDTSIPLILSDKAGAGVVVQSNGNLAVKLDAPANATSYAELSGASSGQPVTLRAQGPANTDIAILPSTGGKITMGGLVKLLAYSVATLPACSTTTQDTIATVADATSPTYRGALTGGGNVRTLVYCDGSSWTSH